MGYVRRALEKQPDSPFYIDSLAWGPFRFVCQRENHDNSDIDIAIETKMSDYFTLYDFKENLENTFHTKVDVVRIRDKMNLSLKNRILREGIYV
ncbi:MAG: nucleotidyltransferase domain-containing protein [Sulfuricurvum sp.]|nr:nucleotidyltransferase domain-containing protein [Sulfuricurvum sp.]